MREVDVQALEPRRLEELIGAERAHEFRQQAALARAALAGRRVLNVNSTATGGGVAELLQMLLAHARGVGVDARWAVVDGDAPFFEITKRIHNHLYGLPGDGGSLGAAEAARYRETLERDTGDLLSLVRPGDIVVLHDPQTAALAGPLHDAGTRVVWRCHIGRDHPNESTEAGWRFLRPFVEPADRFVFSQLRFAPDWMAAGRVREIMPSIDPFSAKNEPLEPELATAVLQYVGLLAGECDPPAVSFTRRDGSPGRIDRHVDILQTGPPPPADAPIVAQLSRWDRLKDMPGVLRAFAEHVDRSHGAHLVLAGPAVHGVADDPEAAGVLDECEAVWRSLPESARSHVHLACVPMHDPDEAAVIANALQRHAAVVTQKSIAEGFGLTVVEAMWKHRPVVASRVGGIVAQVRDGENGLLVDDPEDLAAFGAAVDRLLGDADLAHRLGDAAYRTAHEEFLGDRHLERWAALFGELLD